MTRFDSESLILAYEQPPERVVSLVPSMTGTFFDMGLGDKLIAVTDYCQPPPEAESRLTRVGGSKSPEVEAVIGLEPDLVIANQEENSKQAVEALEAAGLNVWLSFPRSTLDALDLLWTVVKLYGLTQQGASVETLARTLDWTEKATTARLAIPTFVPIWMDSDADPPYFMTFNYRTYAHDVLAKCGGMNVFAGRNRRYPLEADLGGAEPAPAGKRDTRYPRVTKQEVLDANPELILLPDEPFPFDVALCELVKQELGETPAVKNGDVRLVDGSLITWPGTRLGAALAELPGLVAGETI